MDNSNTLRDSLYLTDDPNETTFKYDNQLPSLPVPTLEASGSKILDTLKPLILDQSTFEQLEAKVRKFIADPQVRELQELLEKRAREQKNWLESWWLEFAYLRSRKPLIPFSNMAAPMPIKPYWPIMKPSTDLQAYHSVRARRAALSIFFKLSFWQMLRDEQMRPMVHKGIPWSMAQFRYLFNTVRRPGDPKDELLSWFRTTREGESVSNEIIVLHKGHVFAIRPITQHSPKTYCILAAPQIERQLTHIEDTCRLRQWGPCVGALTTLERSEWSEARSKLIAISDGNRRILDRIEKALFVLVLDDREPESESEMLRLSMCGGDPRNRWADKSVSSIAFRNGMFGASADHTPYDGFCTSIMTHYMMTSTDSCRGQWSDELSKSANSHLASYEEPELLSIKVDSEIILLVEEAVEKFSNICNTIDSLHSKFTHYGKALLKDHRFHPEAFVQCAIHAAYYRLHNKMASTYVTASTRRFYNGRTETCRSCYPEMKQWAECFSQETVSPAEAYELLRLSVHKFQKVMDEASQGLGCDRHMMGLYLTAILENKPTPSLLDDELIQKSNIFTLSTSCGGYWNVCGGVPPLVEDGYGCFYSIEDDVITICCTSFRNCQDTNLNSFYQSLHKTLLDMQVILLRSRQ